MRTETRPFLYSARRSYPTTGIPLRITTLNNPIAADRLNYDVLYHTDLGRERGKSNGLDLSRLNWGNYDLVVIDESQLPQRYRNSCQYRRNRYVKLMEKVIRAEA